MLRSKRRGSKLLGMKSIRSLLLIAIAMFGICCGQRCMAETAEEMLSACRPVMNAKVTDGKINLPLDFDSGSCWGAFGAIQDLLTAVNASTKKPMFGVCLSESTTRTQLIAIFVRYAEKHPERYNERFVWVADNAIREAFPCPVQK
jgi:hypothetical protein